MDLNVAACRVHDSPIFQRQRHCTLLRREPYSGTSRSSTATLNSPCIKPWLRIPAWRDSIRHRHNRGLMTVVYSHVAGQEAILSSPVPITLCACLPVVVSGYGARRSADNMAMPGPKQHILAFSTNHKPRTGFLPLLHHLPNRISPALSIPRNDPEARCRCTCIMRRNFGTVAMTVSLTRYIKAR
jgi:hypothetical protein